MTDYEGVEEGVAVLATMTHHVALVRAALGRIESELHHRGAVHDLSKLSPEELPGFVRINATARRHSYASPQYKEALDAERPTIELHTMGNDHHPEAHPALSEMGWLDIIEMVCDWWSATQTYGQTKWGDALTKQRGRFTFTDQQWWLIEQVAELLDPDYEDENIQALNRGWNDCHQDQCEGVFNPGAVPSPDYVSACHLRSYQKGYRRCARSLMEKLDPLTTEGT